MSDVTVLSCAASPSEPTRATLLATLRDDEERKRRTFHRTADADRFLVGRGMLRIAVGRLLGVPPRDVELELGEHGKPLIAGAHANVSHSGDVVLIALCRDRALGIDVERIESRHAEPGAMKIAFCDDETRAIAALPEELRTAAFFHVWVTREAVIKAIGAGFSMPVENIAVCVDPRLPPAVLATHASLPAFWVQPIPVAPGHVAALAVVGAEPATVTIEVVT
jgi:4'-phosphopantetheinyl transferase